MLVIVEGPDCARKSTLVDALARELEREYPHDSVEVRRAAAPSGHPLDEYVTPLLDYRPHGGRHVLCDRWHLGEVVYPAVFDRATRLDPAVLAYVELFLRSRGALLVVVTPPVDELLRCLRTRGDPLVDERQLVVAREGFVDAATRSSLPLIWLKDEVVAHELTYAVISEALTYASLAASPRLDDFVTYVGDVAPRTILLGDVRRTGSEPGDLRPAFMPYPATSGHYLLRAFAADARFPGARVGLANACDVDDVRALVARLAPREVVALGANAARAVAGARLGGWAAERRAPHPQYWRRFRHHDLAEYRDLVLGAHPWN